jgi:hypothetical protein
MRVATMKPRPVGDGKTIVLDLAGATPTRAGDPGVGTI